VDSLVTNPGADLALPDRSGAVLKKMGVTEQMIRLSVGIEHVEDLIGADLEKTRALGKLEQK
jgi:O-acetylhomoserine/O-acetylserine sulfhydrylase-like pyridoxal-dependent enzyme